MLWLIFKVDLIRSLGKYEKNLY